MARRVSILGSTGSIGESTLSLIRDAEPDTFTVVCLTACNNAKLLAEQAIEFKPETVVLANAKNAEELKTRLANFDVDIQIGREALIEAGRVEADFIMAAIIGAAGLEPTLAAVEQGTYVGLANKECLVCAGSLFMDAVQRSGTVLLPVDSEHNAIFQVLDRERPKEVRKLILTASGGPFREYSAEQLKNVTRAQALSHPVWEMGEKITIDSATLMNKGLELIEASYLFNRPSEEIDIVIHPQSIVHSLVDYVDGSVLAQLGSPDMRTPIAYALAWPNRMPTSVKPLRLSEISKLEFFEPEPDKFPALHLARTALEAGGAAPTVLNAANEIAVAGFLENRLTFSNITMCIETVLNRFKSEQSFAKPLESIEHILELDNHARDLAHQTVLGMN